jgi:hypothetical protein
MPITIAEIVPGAVAYFDVDVLNGDPTVTQPASETTRSGPFLCFAVNGNTSGWAAVSTRWNKDRIRIERAWRSGGADKWLAEDQYLNDGSTTYVGPHDAFVAASRIQDKKTPATRPRVEPDGVAVVAAEVQRRGGNMP